MFKPTNHHTKILKVVLNTKSLGGRKIDDEVRHEKENLIPHSKTKKIFTIFFITCYSYGELSSATKNMKHIHE